METLIVARRFRGPTSSANGGYVAGLVAQLARRSVTVRLMKPPPLETPLRIEERDGLVGVLRGEEVVAQARPGDVGDLAATIPARPAYAEAVEATHRYAGYSRHPAPSCFVCGPERQPGDGLCLFPGRVSAVAAGSASPADSVVAAPWIPDASLDAGGGAVKPEFMWAALDCPGYIAVATDMRAMLLGEITARVDRAARIGERCIVIGWHVGSSGRKHEAGTAVLGEDGVVAACARALWIEPRGAVAVTG